MAKFEEKQLAWIITGSNPDEWVITSVTKLIKGKPVFYDLKNIKTGIIYKWVKEDDLASFYEVKKAKEKNDE